MRNDESGEFEVVLGNRQLLSGFFIVVVLFGVFFTMGYIVGRNSAPSERTATPPPAAPLQADAREPAAGAALPAESVEAPETPGGEEEPAPLSSTQPVRQEEAEAAAPAEPERAPAPEDTAPPAPGLVEPGAGDVYLQVMAVRRPEAEVVAKTLRAKGFRTVLGQGPNQLVRVLVGPFHDTASLGQAKAGLENAGFHPIVRK
jgi:cell division septation protein DedD